MGEMTINRKPIFKAVRAMLGRGFVDAEVGALDAAISEAVGSTTNVLQPSQAIADYVRGVEKLAKLRSDGSVEAYMPTANDVPTIGYGETGPDIKMGLVWTVAQAEQRFAKRFAEFACVVRAALGAAPTTQGQFDAMVSLAYNIGVQAFRDSTLLRLHKEGKYTEAKAQFARWNKQAGKVLNGLTFRREHEAGIYG